MSAAADIAPLVVRVDPIPGESLMSLVTRSAHANVFPSLADLLTYIGWSGHPAFLPFKASAEDAGRLATLLNLDASAILERLHAPVSSASGREEVGWAQGRLERRSIEARVRRVSPASLRCSPHHRLTWTNRALSFCPESFELLISSCPSCHRALGWTRTLGPDRCESCRGSLLDPDPIRAPEVLRPALAGAAALADPDPVERDRALDALPSAFHAFDPGEAFTAAVELGVAWSLPEAARGSDVARQSATGRLSISAEMLAAGYQVLQGWPQSYGELVGRIWRAQQAAGAPSMALRQLGVLGRWFDHRLADTAFGKCLREGAEDAARRGGMPLKRPGRPPAGCMDADLLTLTEASELTGVSKATLSRLVPEGACLAGGKLGRGGAVYLRPAELAQSLSHLQSALTPARAASVLGVPAYCLPAFVEAGLLNDVEDSDAMRLAGVDRLYGRASVDTLVKRVRDRAAACRFIFEPLAPRMRRRFRPPRWAEVFAAMANGQLEIGLLPVARPGLLFELGIDDAAARGLVAQGRGEPPTKDVVLSASDVGLLLGISDIFVPEVISTGLLPASRQGRLWRILLSDLAAFDQSYALSNELAEVFDLPPRGAGRGSDFYASAIRTRHLRVIHRGELKFGAVEDGCRENTEQTSAGMSQRHCGAYVLMPITESQRRTRARLEKTLEYLVIQQKHRA